MAPEMLRTVLDLPPEYEVQPTHSLCHTIHVEIRALHLPEIRVGQPPHLVKPIYRRVTPTHAELDRIEIVESSQRTDPCAIRAY